MFGGSAFGSATFGSIAGTASVASTIFVIKPVIVLASNSVSTISDASLKSNLDAKLAEVRSYYQSAANLTFTLLPADIVRATDTEAAHNAETDYHNYARTQAIAAYPAPAGTTYLYAVFPWWPNPGAAPLRADWIGNAYGFLGGPTVNADRVARRFLGDFSDTLVTNSPGTGGTTINVTTGTGLRVSRNADVPVLPLKARLYASGGDVDNNVDYEEVTITSITGDAFTVTRAGSPKNIVATWRLTVANTGELVKNLDVATGAAAHELGHAFGLPHPTDDPSDPGPFGTRLMDTGFYNYPNCVITSYEVTKMKAVSPRFVFDYTAPPVTSFLAEPDMGWASDWDVTTSGVGAGTSGEIGTATESVSTTGLNVVQNQNRTAADFGIFTEVVFTSGLGSIIVTPPPPITPVDVPGDEDWAVDGFALQTFAYNIVTWGGSRQAPPKLKGGNVGIPFRAGQRWKKKTIDSRVQSLAMWVIGANPDGTVASRQIFERNWRVLRRMLWTPDKEINLSKTFYDDISNGFITAVAKAQYVDGLSPDMNGMRRASFVVDLLLADPFFYDNTTRSFNIPVNGIVPVPSFGDYPTVRMTVTFNGPLVRPRLLNTITGVWVKFNGILGAGESVILDVENFTSTKAGVNNIAEISHSGDFHWMRLGGVNFVDALNTTDRLSVDTGSGSGSGHVAVTATPVWL